MPRSLSMARWRWPKTRTPASRPTRSTPTWSSFLRHRAVPTAVQLEAAHGKAGLTVHLESHPQTALLHLAARGRLELDALRQRCATKDAGAGPAGDRADGDHTTICQPRIDGLTAKLFRPYGRCGVTLRPVRSACKHIPPKQKSSASPPTRAGYARRRSSCRIRAANRSYAPRSPRA